MTSIDFHNFLRTRQSIRRFKPEPVPAPVIERILETAIYAPSAHNLQPWRFAIVTDISARTRLGKALTDKMRADMTAVGAAKSTIESRADRSLRRIEEAPILILLCRDVTAIRAPEQKEIIMSIQSVAAGGLQLLLAAHAEGLGGTWICWPLYAQEAARAAMNLPETWEPQAMFFLGYAERKDDEKMLKPHDDIVLKI